MMRPLFSPSPSPLANVPTAQRATWALHGICLLVLVALVTSSALAVDSLLGTPNVCRFDGCTEVQASAWGRPLGLPLPFVGVTVFGLAFALLMAPGRLPARAVRPLLLAAGATGLVLAGVQVLAIRRLCPLCLVVDSSAVLAALLGVATWRQEPSVIGSWSRASWVVAAGLAVTVPACLGFAHFLRDTPPQVKAYWQPGKVTVVEVIDFECKQCRAMDPVLGEVLREHNGPIHLVVVPTAMPEHTRARDAARAYLTACKFGKGKAMAAALVRSPSLYPGMCEELAVSVGIPRGDYQKGVADPALDAQIDADLRWIQAATPNGLPAIWIEDRLLEGVQSPETLQQAIREAEALLAH